MATNLTQIVNNMNTCATSAGFNAFKFGDLSSINFDHNISYDLLNFAYPKSTLIDINSNLQEYSCTVTAFRPISKSNVTGVELVDNVHVIMTALENRLLNFLSCFGASNNCKDIITSDAIDIFRNKGTHNDRLVSVTCNFSLEVFVNCIDIDCTSTWPPAPVADSYNCVNGDCIDPGDGSGAFATLAECEASGC